MDDTPYYLVTLVTELTADEYLAVAKRLKRYMKAHGFEIDEFGDSSHWDREATILYGKARHFEGQVVFPKDKTWKELLPKFFANEGLSLTSIKTEEYDEGSVGSKGE